MFSLMRRHCFRGAITRRFQSTKSFSRCQALGKSDFTVLSKTKPNLTFCGPKFLQLFSTNSDSPTKPDQSKNGAPNNEAKNATEFTLVKLKYS